MPPEELRMFLFGVLGGLSVEAINVVRTYESGKPLAPRYTRPVYLIVRVLLALGGGVVAAAHKTGSDLLSLHIGASVPAILQVLAAKPPD
ncbi:MAG: hypothetical protein J0I06_15105 [Planctomycetes bacterium]|nr:hypothetical protein [Planctomycetota bacterium]